MKSVSLVATVALASLVALVLNNNQVVASVNIVKLTKEFKDSLLLAEKLESASIFTEDENDEKSKVERANLLYRFARQPKSLMSFHYLDATNNEAEEFRLKAHAYLDDMKKPNKGPFYGIFGSGPLASMRVLGKYEPFLSAITERYVLKVKNNMVNDNDIDCDLLQFQAKNLHEILFLLQTDIKHLLLDDQQVLNQAIYEKLKGDKYISANNFYESSDLKPKQKEVLLRFFADRVDHNQLTLNQAVDHFNKPSEYILGRVMDSCVASLSYQGKLAELEFDFNDVCPRAISNPGGDKVFLQKYSFDRFEHIIQFCQDFLDAL